MTTPNPSQNPSQDANTSTVPVQQVDKKKTGTEQTEEGKLTGAELKKRAKAEKAARRAKEKEDREGGGSGGTPKKQSGSAPGGSGGVSGGPGGGGGPGAGGPRRGSTQTGPEKREKREPEKREREKREDKKVAVFGHLYGQQRRASVAGAGKEVHPAVLALGLQMRDYVVCGSSARCVATLLAFKRVFLSVLSSGVVCANEIGN